jgi:hypothetical protein
VCKNVIKIESGTMLYQRRLVMAVPPKPLSRIQNLVEKLGLKITYAYDDLVFVEHNAFLIKMGKRGEDVSVYVNVDADKKQYPAIIDKLANEGKKEELIVKFNGKFKLKDAGNEQIQIEFLEKSEV